MQEKQSSDLQVQQWIDLKWLRQRSVQRQKCYEMQEKKSSDLQEQQQKLQRLM
jgi:hypothetical protein